MQFKSLTACTIAGIAFLNLDSTNLLELSPGFAQRPTPAVLTIVFETGTSALKATVGQLRLLLARE